ncbi:HDOD domain-containing protein [Rhodanobacter denitrificans]|nr:HDOD domain-containing protein [Rhodanobacter denitrificans]
MTARAPPMAPITRSAMPPAELEDRFHRFVFDLPDSDAGKLRAAELATLRRLELLGTRFDVRNLPRLPVVLPQLLRTLKSGNAAGGQLATLIGRDPLIVGEVMRVTGSVHYRAAQPINSLQQAVVVLGQEGLHRVLVQHVMKPILQSNAGAFGHAAGERLWSHAERCAHACAWLGKASGCDAFEAYLAGVICHTGTGAVVRLLGRLAPTDGAPPSPHFLAGCADLAARLTLQAAQHWELPPRVIDAITEYRNRASPAASPLGKALVVADQLAMAQLLGEHDRIAQDLDLGPAWPESFAPASVVRCQHDLRRNFPPREGA